MMWAIDDRGTRINAYPAGRALCPCCHAQVIAKCGQIVAHHWAHDATADCDPWREPETPWHVTWKSRFPAAWQETVVGGHRADVRTPRGLVIEFQNSAISPEAIAEREQFYGRMLWVINARPFFKHLSLRKKDDGAYYTFRWRWPRKSVWFMTRPVYFDLGVGRIFRVRAVHPHVPCGGWGILNRVDHFVSRVIAAATAPQGVAGA